MPRYAKLLLDSERFGCGSDIVTLVAMLSTDNVFLLPKAAKNRVSQ